MKKGTKLNLIVPLQLLTFVFAIFFTMAFACNDGGDSNLPVIPGTAWKIEPGIKGANVQVFLFCKNGRWEVVSSQLLKVKDLASEGGSATFKGTYTVRGNTITTKMGDGTIDNYKMSWNGTILELNDGQTILKLYDKVETDCE